MIATLERLVGQDLPLSYRDFLARMGYSNHLLRLAWSGSTDIDEVISYYEDVSVGEAFPPPSDCIAISTQDLAAGAIYLRAASGRPEPHVITTCGGREFHAESLRKLLFHKVFTLFRLPRLGESTFLYAEAGGTRLPEAAAFARDEGIEEQWFSDAASWCGEGHGSAVVFAPQHGGLWMRVTAATPERLDALSLRLERKLCLFRSR